MFQLPNSKYFKLMDYLIAHIVIAVAKLASLRRLGGRAHSTTGLVGMVRGPLAQGAPIVLRLAAEGDPV